MKEEDSLPHQIFGSENLQNEIKKALERFHGIFARQVRPEPAKLPAFHLELTLDETWTKSKSNSGRPRPVTNSKQNEMDKQVEQMLDLQVIELSTALNYSQVHMVPKVPEGWRFALDYRELNLNTRGYSWPIPNIREMFARIGEQHPKYFCVLDLTSGYHQIEVANPSRALTAFITQKGIFQFKRLPMGIKGAPAYFQKMMTSIVLVGLVYQICEVYLDDCLVYAQTEKQLIINLYKIFERFEKYNLTLNPKKCRFGMTEVEYVGVVLNEHGLSFSKEKKDSIMNFPKPIVQKQLKSFVGLANYFRTHVLNHSTIIRPLEGMLTNYKRTTRLEWTDEQIQAFEDMKLAIHNCQTLTFLDGQGEVHLKTDASYYGMGALLYQIRQGNEYPVACLSKTLSKEQLRWKVPEKECYAIFWSFKKLAYLIRDIHFT